MTKQENIKKKFTQVLVQDNNDVWYVDPYMLNKITARYAELSSVENQKFLNEFVDFLNLSKINEDFDTTFDTFEKIYG